MENLMKSGYLSHPMQAYTLRKITIAEGKSRGMMIIEISTAGGLQVDIMADTGLDIGKVMYKGINVSFISKNGYDNPDLWIPYENEFLHTFPGGLLFTSGLRSTGPANRDGDEWHPLHGRYHSLRADQLSTEVVNDEIIISGTVRETSLFGCCLSLKRTIRIPVFGASITVSDQLTNETPREEEFAILYHCNFGYPMLSEKAFLVLPQKRKTTPRTAFAATGIDTLTRFDQPVPGEEERVFFHEGMEHTVSLINPELDIKAALTWTENLPVLAHWRSMASGDYALGLEPTNSYIMGRHDERENGTLQHIKPFETITMGVRFDFDKAN